MKKVLAAMTFAVLSGLTLADDAVQQIEEVVVTGAVRGNEAITIAAINLPGDAELAELPVVAE